MRVSKRQLRRIIREEKSKLITEGSGSYGKLYNQLATLQDDIRETVDGETLDMILRETRRSSDAVDRAMYALALDVKKFHARMG